jgi:hypothetical protein
MVNLSSLHGWVMEKLEEKRIAEITISQCTEEHEREKLKKLHAIKFKNLPNENEYMLDVVILQTNIESEDNGDEKNMIYYKFVKKHFVNVLDNETLSGIRRGCLDERQFQKKEMAKQINRCQSCESEKNLLACTKQNTLVCTECGISVDSMILIPNWEQEKELPKKKSGYTKQKTMSEALDFFLCRKKMNVPPAKLNLLKAKVEHIPLEYLTIKMMKSAMKELNMSKYYIQMYLIYKALTGKMVTLAPDGEKIIHYLFYLQKDAFSDLRAEGEIDRTNIFVYRYSICKNLEITIHLANLVRSNKPTSALYLVEDDEEDDEGNVTSSIYKNILTRRKLRDVNIDELNYALRMVPSPIIESPENLMKYDHDWAKICKRCNLPFFESL